VGSAALAEHEADELRTGPAVPDAPGRWTLVLVMESPGDGAPYRCTVATGTTPEADAFAAAALAGRTEREIAAGPGAPLMAVPCAEVVAGGAPRHARHPSPFLGAGALEVAHVPLAGRPVVVTSVVGRPPAEAAAPDPRHGRDRRGAARAGEHAVVDPGAGGDADGAIDVGDVLADRDGWREIVRHAPESFVLLRADGRLAYHSAPRLLGYPEGSLVGRDPFDLVHPGDVGRARAALAESVAHPGPVPPLELRVRRADGSWRWVEVTATNLLEHPRVGGLLLTLRDLTARLRADAEARASEDRFRTLAELGPSGVFVADGQGRVLYANRRLADIVGVPWRQLVGHRWQDWVDPVDTPLVHRIRTTMHDGPITLRLRSGDGRARAADLNLAELPADDSDDLAVVGSLNAVGAASDAEASALDPLTGLPDRGELLGRLDVALTMGEPLALLVVDLDGFAAVNDALGAAAGDVVLSAAAARLQSVVRPEDTVARCGADEFLVLCLGADATVVGPIADRLIQRLAVPFVARAARVRVTASVGVALGDDGGDPDAVVAAAARAMEAARRRGGNRFERAS
jgi:diguanylate cyclase (GGDEF)-like protein/PAS domain S-box-containing protein